MRVSALAVVQVDIATQEADALVNAANTGLRMGTGVAGFSLAAGARIVCEVIDGFEPDSLRDVRFIAYSDEDYETVKQVAADVQG